MGRIVVLTGPSGSGKTSIARKLLELPRTYMVTSLITRERRESDLPDEYLYVRLQDVVNMYNKRQLLWVRQVGKNRYATSRESVVRAVRHQGSTHIMILVPDRVDALLIFIASIGCSVSDVLPIFVLPPPEEELRRRLSLQNRALGEVEQRTEEAGWEEFARTSRVQFRFISNDGPLSETVKKICSLFV